MKAVALLPDSLGDFLLTTPSLRSLEAVFKPQEIDWIVPDSLLDAANLVALKANRIPFSELKPYGRRADYIFSFPPATRYHKLAKRLGGKRRIGYVHEKMLIPRIVGRFGLTDRWICPAKSTLHELEAYGKLLEIVSIPFRPEFPESTLKSKKERNRIGIHLNSRWPKNPLPMLKEIKDLVVFAAPEFSGQARRWIEKSKLNDLIFPGVLSLKAFAEQIQSLSLLVTIDGGPVHLAAFLETPSVVFYPEEQFAYRVVKWRPWRVRYQALPLTEFGLKQLPAAIQKAF